MIEAHILGLRIGVFDERDIGRLRNIGGVFIPGFIVARRQD